MDKNSEYTFLTSFARQGFFDKNPTVWFNGARPPPKILVKFLLSNYDFGKVII
jgi:hypothetical protein